MRAAVSTGFCGGAGRYAAFGQVKLVSPPPEKTVVFSKKIDE